MDAKGRISLPARFRELLAARSENFLVLTVGVHDPALWCFTPSSWAAFQDKVAALPMMSAQARSLRHTLIANAQDCPLDGAGRVLVPPMLRQFAGLSGNSVWAGVLDRIELWNAQSWQKRSEEALANLADPNFAETLAGLGL